ncbi:hypothetical protein [Glaciibacter sp. 2TAF33]|uniref:hypothetical protein n=1 Tax=Glaciibacter sp. 2TAF33 TaxID=3233015 RepID=UPI003F8E242C
MANGAGALLEEEDPIDDRDIEVASPFEEPLTVSSPSEDYDWLGGLTARGGGT